MDFVCKVHLRLSKVLLLNLDVGGRGASGLISAMLGQAGFKFCSKSLVLHPGSSQGGSFSLKLEGRFAA